MQLHARLHSLTLTAKVASSGKTVPLIGLADASERRRLRREFSRRSGLGRDSQRRRRARLAVGISAASKAPAYHASSFVMCRDCLDSPLPRGGVAHGNLIALRSIPLTSPETVAYFCHLHMCSMSVNGHDSAKFDVSETTPREGQ